MAENKKSFILYCDLIHTVKKMPIKKAGELFVTILEYVNDLNPEVNDLAVDLVFEPIKHQLKRDLKKWDRYIDKQRENGKLGGRPKEPKETQITQAFPKEPKKADNVNATVTVNVNDNVNEGGNTAATKFSKEYTSNAEETITKNQIEFQRICAGAGISYELGAEALHKYHLHLEEKEGYPKGRKAVFAGFEKWMANEKNFQINRKNGTHQQPNRSSIKAGSKSSGAHKLVDQMRDEFNRSGQ